MPAYPSCSPRLFLMMNRPQQPERPFVASRADWAQLRPGGYKTAPQSSIHSFSGPTSTRPAELSTIRNASDGS
jgi:hypothetical protein